MLKTLIALVVATAGAAAPAVAGTVHDFNPNLTNQRSLDGQCYDTTGGANVCFYRINGETFNVAVVDPAVSAQYPHVFTVNCDSGIYKGFGPMRDARNAAFARHFCDNGRY